MSAIDSRLALAFAMVTLAGCSKTSSSEATVDAGQAAGASAIASVSAPVASPSAAATEDFDTPPPSEKKADHKAAREITKANYKAELTKIEKEIGSP